MQRSISQKDLEKVLDLTIERVLFPFQREWIADRSRFKIARKARQIGLSFALGFEGMLDVLSGVPVFYVSRTLRQSVALLAKFYQWADYMGDLGIPFEFSTRSRTECTVNGITVKSLTSNAVGDEGYSGNVYLDEFGLHSNDEQIYSSLLPTASWGFRVEIISRPFGQSNKFHKIFTDEQAFPNYHRYTFDIDRAIRDGVPISRADMAAAFGGESSEGFRENYLCEFIDESVAYLPYELLRSCVGDNASDRAPGLLGADIGRRSDRTTVYVLRKLGDRYYTARLEVIKNQTFAEQRKIIEQIITEEQVHRGCIDATGLGMQLAEELHQAHPLIEAVTFTNDVKESMAVSVKRLFEEKQIQIPDDAQLIADCHAIKRTVTSANNIRFDADRTDEGHADRFWALALAHHAAVAVKPFRVLFEA